VCAASPADVKGLLKSAIRDDDPVMFFEDARLWPIKGDVPTDPEQLVPIGKARVVRPGHDVTIVAIAGAMRPALEAAEALQAEGISAELIDPRTLKPLDMPAIIRSVEKTGRLIVVENGHRTVNAGAEIGAELCEQAFDILKRPIRRLSAPDIHIPFSPVLEARLFPGKDEIIAAARGLM
jgi:acetoin:2,6-dichlorophenolindophenol oxidoreductase subunit beta